jgi:hypothetical protein
MRLGTTHSLVIADGDAGNVLVLTNRSVMHD